MTEQKEVTIRIDSETWLLLERITAALGERPEAWIQSVLRQHLGRADAAESLKLAERVRRFEAPVRSWPEMERRLMVSCLARS